MPKFKVWLNDAGYAPTGSMALPHRREATVIEIEANSAVSSDQGELVFYTPLEAIECFAKGTWTRWKLVG